MPAVNPNNFNYFQNKQPFNILLNSKVDAGNFDYFRGKEPFIIVSSTIGVVVTPSVKAPKRRIFIIN